METAPETVGPEAASADISVATYFVFSAVQKLKQQNETLKSELRQLKSSLETTLKTLKSGEREQHRPNFSQGEGYSGQDGEMETLMAKIQEYKKEATALKHQLTAREDKKIAELENQIAYLKTRVAELESERDSMKIVEKRQMGALQTLKNDAELQRMAQRLEGEIKSCLEKERAAKQKIAKDQVEWKSVHQQMVTLEERFRELQRRKPNALTPETEAHNKELAEWQKKVDILEKSTTTDEKVLKMRWKEVEQKRKEVEEEKSRLDTEIARLNQDIPLKELKQKELKTRLAQMQN